MGTETIKSLLWVLAAVILAVVAVTNLPQRIELENQARVNEPLFPAYQSSSVWTIEIQKPPGQDYASENPGATVEQLTVKRTANRGWELVEFQSFPADNTQRIGQLSSLLNDLKVLEVVSENATEAEMSDYGVLDPTAGTGTNSQVGTRLRLIDANQTPVGDLIVGTPIPQQGQTAATAYVRPADDKAIYRVAFNKSALTTNLVDWINPNPLSIQAPAGVPSLGPAFRTTQTIVVETPLAGRANSDPYRATFQFGEQVRLLELQTAVENQWSSIPAQRLPSSPDFTQAWRGGMQVVPAFFLLSKVTRLSEGLQGELRRVSLNAAMDAGELEPLGIRVQTAGDETQLTGESGRMLVSVQGGVQFEFAVGKPSERGDLVPVLIHASLDNEGLLPEPKLAQLPEESAEWPADQRTREEEKLRREHAQRVQEWNQRNQQIAVDLDLLNERLSAWVFWMPTAYVYQAMPDLRLAKNTVSESATPTPAPVEEAGNAADGSE